MLRDLVPVEVSSLDFFLSDPPIDNMLPDLIAVEISSLDFLLCHPTVDDMLPDLIAVEIHSIYLLIHDSSINNVLSDLVTIEVDPISLFFSFGTPIHKVIPHVIAIEVSPLNFSLNQSAILIVVPIPMMVTPMTLQVHMLIPNMMAIIIARAHVMMLVLFTVLR